MLALTDQQRQAAEAGGKRPHWRLKLSNRTLAWRDLILGDRQAALPHISHRSWCGADGTPTPILASVADDIAFGTTHIIRGDDNAATPASRSSCSRALTAAQAMVRFAHLPALDATSVPHNPRRRMNGRSGSLRSGVAANLSLRAPAEPDGVEPCAFAASIVGIRSSDGYPAYRMEELAQRFELGIWQPPGFDATRMLAINRRVLHGMDFAAVADRLPGGATEAFWLAVRGSLDLLTGSSRLVGCGRGNNRAAVIGRRA